MHLHKEEAEMGATNKEEVVKSVGNAVQKDRRAVVKREKQKKRRHVSTFAGPLTQEGGEAEDEFVGAHVIDLQDEAADVAQDGMGDVEFLTGQLEEIEQRVSSKKRKNAHITGDADLNGQGRSQDGDSNVASEKSSKKIKKENAKIKSSARAATKGDALLESKKPVSGSPQENPRALPLPDPGASRLEQADWFGGCFRNQFGEALSNLEKSDITEEHIAASSGSAAPLSNQLKAFFGPKWKDALLGNMLVDGQEAGSPKALVIAASAKRCVEVLKKFGSEFNSGCQVAKLFAKHFKIEEQITTLKKRVNIAAGTPNRLLKLAEISALNLDCLEVLVLDLHRDAKGLTIVDIPEVRNDFWAFFHRYGAKRIFDGKCKLFFSL